MPCVETRIDTVGKVMSYKGKTKTYPNLLNISGCSFM